MTLLFLIFILQCKKVLLYFPPDRYVSHIFSSSQFDFANANPAANRLATPTRLGKLRHVGVWWHVCLTNFDLAPHRVGFQFSVGATAAQLQLQPQHPDYII